MRYSQPQGGPARLDPARLLAAKAVIVGGTAVNIVSGVPLVTAGTGVARKAISFGIAESFRRNFYRKTESLAIGTSSFIEIWSGVPIAYGALGQSNEAAFLTGSSNNLFGIAANMRSGTGNWGAVYNWPTLNDSSEILPLGVPTTIVVARFQDRMEFWRDGRLVRSIAQAPMNYGTTPMVIGSFVEDTGYWPSSNDTVLAARILGERSAPELSSLSSNPWQLFASPSRRPIYSTVAPTTVLASIAWSEDSESTSVLAIIANRVAVAWTEGSETPSLNAVISNRSSIAWVEGGDSSSVAGTVTDRGSLTWLEQGDTLALTAISQEPAQASIQAAMAWTEASEASALVARLLNRAAVVITEQGDTWALTAYAEQEPIKPTEIVTYRFISLKRDYNTDTIHFSD